MSNLVALLIFDAGSYFSLVKLQYDGMQLQYIN